MVSKLVVTLMIRPQPRLIIGSAANRAIRNAPMQLIARIRCQPSASASKNLIRASLSPAAVDMLTPAQLIRMSSAPKVSTVRRTASRQSAAFDTSATMARNFPAKTGSAARRSRPATSISTAATLAPAAASARAITRPMPLAAPVTMAARPSSNCCSAMTGTSRADDVKSRRTMQSRVTGEGRPSSGFRGCGVRVFEASDGSLVIPGLLEQCFRVPLAPMRGVEKIPAVDVNGARQPVDRIGRRMDDVAPARLGVVHPERFRGGGVQLAVATVRHAAPADVVLATGMDADDRPRVVIVGDVRHLGCPDDIGDRRVSRAMERLEYRPGGLAQTLEDSRRVGHGAGDDVTNELMRFVGRERGAAIGDELVEVEHRLKQPPLIILAQFEAAGRHNVGSVDISLSGLLCFSIALLRLSCCSQGARQIRSSAARCSSALGRLPSIR